MPRKRGGEIQGMKVKKEKNEKVENEEEWEKDQVFTC